MSSIDDINAVYATLFTMNLSHIEYGLPRAIVFTFNGTQTLFEPRHFMYFVHISHSHWPYHVRFIPQWPFVELRIQGQPPQRPKTDLRSVTNKMLKLDSLLLLNQWKSHSYIQCSINISFLSYWAQAWLQCVSIGITFFLPNWRYIYTYIFSWSQ